MTAQALHAATNDLNAAIERLEDTFNEKIPDGRGRVSLSKNPDFIEHLVYKDGMFYYDHGRPGRVRSMPLLEASREVRASAVPFFTELFRVSGGIPVKEPE